MTMHDMNEGLKRSGFWAFNFGHVIVLMAMAGAFLVWWSSFGSLPSHTAEAVASLAMVVKDINDKGTMGSRLENTKQEADLQQLNIRVTKLENNYAELNGKLQQVQDKLDVIAALLEGKKK